MLRRHLALALLTAMSAAARAVEYPVTDREEVVDTYQGPGGKEIEVTDPYRWLEADVRESDRVAAWVAQQQAVTEAYLADLPERQSFVDELTKLWNYERRSAPSRFGKPGASPERYAYSKNDGLQNQSVLYLGDSPQSEGRVLIDPNQWSEDGTIALAGTSTSYDGKLLAYQRSEAGSDWRVIRVLDVETGNDLDDELRWVKFGGVQWTPDGKGFYYSRYPEPEEGAAYQASALNRKLCYHQLGDPQEKDVVVYEDPEHPDWSAGLWLSEDGAWLVVAVSKGTDNQNRLYVRKADGGANDGGADWIPLVEDFENEFNPIASEGDRLYLLTDQDAPQRRVVTFDLARAGEVEFRDTLVEVVPESAATLESASLVGGVVFVQYLEDVAAVVRRYSPRGAPLGEVELPGVGSVYGFGGWQDATETFYTYTSYDAPPTTYRYDIASGESTLLFQPDVGVDFSKFTVRREFYESKDGTRVPIFLTHRKDLELNGNNPTLLYAYGGFTISITPGYSASRMAWVEHGGVLAVANLRGGGEYGEPWHEAGKLRNKQNVFDDFIAAAEWLVAEKITSPEHLAIQGGSNGGLLVGAVMTQRPDLFGACLPAVGVMDMLRFHTFTAGQFWRDEYGSSDDPAMIEYLLGYSPFHNVKPGVAYPPTLVTTADTDDRVVPMHSFKFAAALQHAQQTSEAGDNPLLIRIESRAGHGAGTPTKKLIEQAADLWAFLWEHVGP
ncbi:Prolyl endopeptidase [Botrimarina colliarenosi]|uniref:prolyl oligopeptidase n=1 Tax=Botrimarina colliarenosi TaxID=2528001 RepID=A0A5C6AKN4_9BACT|nr:prolyl oligopeptidase family serine peptidase [Botrimarina colliarenosi]TWU00585.1 Prolyl endopeptidase [Botrimarina colliarenosi]